MTTSRRGFLGGFAAALAGFSILPAATTYTRLWKAVQVPKLMPNPAYENATYQAYWVSWTTAVPYLARRYTGQWKWEPKPLRFELDPKTGLFSRVNETVPV